ncbi:exonuclease SbcCD subunit D [Candidatus Riflebacteria bacterium]
MRFIHTADWQIGMKALFAGQKGARLREERLKAAARVVEITKTEAVDFLLLCGDTFEDNGVDRLLVRNIIEILKKADCPVFILPGNHDPLVPGSVWEHPGWEHTNLIILKERKPIEVPGGMLYPCPIMQKSSRKNPCDWIAEEGNAGIRIGVAHGSIPEITQSDEDFPISLNTVTKKKLDYLALGHWHSFNAFDDRRTFYSGTHESTSFRKKESGGVLLVDISHAGEEPRVKKLPTGSLKWIALEKEISTVEDIMSLKREVEECGDPENSLLDIRLSGYLTAEGFAQLTDLEDFLQSRFLLHRIEQKDVQPAPENMLWVNALPQGALQQTAIKLQQLSTNPKDTEQGEIAKAALLEIFTIIKREER